MPITLNNSPIVELIAELRWDVEAQPVVGGPGPTMSIVSDPAGWEAFFMRFAAHAFAADYVQIERIAPHGFPLFVHQAAFRFRTRDGKGPLLQVGPGLLTVNATPPYKTWGDFAPEIRKGLTALFAARDEKESRRSFNVMNLRYIDAFNRTHIRSHDVATFMRDVLRIDLQLPISITKHALAGKDIKPAIQLQVPMSDDRMMSFGFGDGMANNEPAYVMDTTISTLRVLEPDIEALMEEFCRAQVVIHEMFFSMTEPIYELMQPEGEV